METVLSSVVLLPNTSHLVQEGGGEPPKSSLGWAIDTHFGSLEALIQKMNAEGAALQGSGWVVSSTDSEIFSMYSMEYGPCVSLELIEVPCFVLINLYCIASGLVWTKN